MFGNTEIEKRKFYHYKNLYEYFIGYKDNDYRITRNPSINEKRAHM